MRLTRLVSSVGIVFGLALFTGFAAARAEDGGGGPPPAPSFTPPNGARGVCPDTPLTLTFDREPRIGRSGALHVYRSDGSLVDSIDLADPRSATRSVGGARLRDRPYTWSYHPILVPTSGRRAGF